MNIARFSINAPVTTWIVMLVCLFGGIWGFFSLGRLEDPAFTIKTAVVVTHYPGASADQVMIEVTEPLEAAIQGMGQVERITSSSRPGVSRIDVEIRPTYDGTELPEVWAELRNKVEDAQLRLPQGARTPIVNDSFGDVFGVFFAVTAEGFNDAEKHDLARFLRREMLAVDGVANVELMGLPEEAIYVEPDIALMKNQNISPAAILNALASSNSVAPAGSLRQDGNKVRIQTPEGSDSVDEIAALSIGVGGEVLNLVDIADVSRGRRVDPGVIIRHDGLDAFTLGIAGLASENIVEVGNRIDARLAELQAEIPVGAKLHPIYQQHIVVDEASTAFLWNLAMSVAIVVVVLGLFMGPRAAIVVGATLLLTVVGTLLFMAIFSIEMERISLGALIIAMGMLVDNAIVVAEGMQTAMLRGKSSRDAATEATAKTQIPLLGATVIGIMAFAGIGLSPDATGEFLFSLFAVIAISLLLSWVLAVTATPLLGHYFFKVGHADNADAYSGPLFRMFAWSLRLALKLRWLVVAGLLVVTVGCYYGFTHVKQQFFPNSNTPLFFVHYTMPQGTAINTTAEQMAVLEEWLLEREEVVDVATFVGQGATRFLLTYASEPSNSGYGHLVIRTQSEPQIAALRAELDAYAAEVMTDGEFRSARLVFGPGSGAQIQARISGKDPEVLRDLADQVMTAMTGATPNALLPRTNWREQELVLTPNYVTERAQTAGITRDDVANLFNFATDGVTAGVYRESDRQLPIIVRTNPDAGLSVMDQVVATPTGAVLPVEQVIDGFTLEAQNTLIQRRNRVPTITVGVDVPVGFTAAQVFAELRQQVEDIPMPPGYKMEWGGEHEDSAKANESLGRQLPIALLIMVLISILLFNALRQPLIIWLLVPMSVNGVAFWLLLTGVPFSFTALLGLLSLSGMLIKNGIVLVEEIDLVRADGVALDQAIVDASVSRLRPVALAAATTILGMIPLLTDPFFVSMAITIMGGLAFASVLTLVAAPVFYAIFFKKDEKRRLAALAA